MTSPLLIARHPGSGRPVVFLHGLASRGAQDWPEAEWAHALDGRPRLVVDLPAHGDSPALGTAPTAAVLDALAEGIGAEEVDVVAYSLGARLAWDLARRSDVSVRRLVLGGLSAGEPFAAVDLAAARSAIAGGAAPGDPLTAMIAHMIAAPGNRPGALLDLIEGLAAEPFAPNAEGPRMPVLLLGGADDAMAAGIDALAALLPDARTARVPGDHLAALHAPELRDAVRGFLAG
ncbi:alpha/beta fold hydrolase [Microbacterium saperdae]|uniref:Pimeloyl-ACP methyl ester carboxylesterase n=1 Tax=Microbacterium saperdae TaxID=69368 RepID=A0A543BPZ2_9MICO|nr:alpha/beta hydrolase [Microbacterium saperdae]TQL86894.1 pimeloyl-ACP methyl ester carboxylesterase [Microbacterium saperdae]GGM44556.1 alpha/beta hydrolase [Microbacterium saperdae]